MQQRARDSCSVHPHACGELFLDNENMFFSLRFIPTHVGNSFRQAIQKMARPVHPHACGELSWARLWSGMQFGSSPRMWGTLINHIISYSTFRFIPTHVGNSKLIPISTRCASVHPHACGELRRCFPRSNGVFGSSPRMWGTPLLPGTVPLPVRFIPTHVGNSLSLKCSHWRAPVHPHACGELLPHF